MRTKKSGEWRRGAVPGEMLRLAVRMVLALGLIIPVAMAQKPGPAPAPTPSPGPAPSPNPTTPIGTPGSNSTNPLSSVDRMEIDRVMFLRGSVATTDGSKVPHDLLVERMCNGRVVQQVYAGPLGDFSMQLGSRNNTVIDASGDEDMGSATSPNGMDLGIPKRNLLTCELRASAAGFQQGTLRLMDLTVTTGTVDVGRIIVQRMGTANGATGGTTLNAAAYRAPKDALKAYEKGMAAEQNEKYADAEKYFEKAVEIYPKYGSAWYELGVTRQKTKDRDGAKAAFTEATRVDKKMLAPYLKLTEMAYAAKDWPEVLQLTEHIIDMDPMGRTNVTGYVLDLDPINAGMAYYYNAMANYELGRIDAAEKSALKAEHVDLLTHFPQLHLLLAEIHSQKGNYGGAIAEIETYMELVPGAKDAAPLRARLAKLEELNGKASGEKRE